MALLYKPGRPSTKEPPCSAGEYRFINKNTKEIDYLGETNNLKRRMREHERSNKPISRDTHHFAWKEADGRFSAEKRRDHERRKIKEKKPPLNIRSGGGGRITRRSRKDSSVMEGIYIVERRKRGFAKSIFDIIMVFGTGGLWLFWMLIRAIKNRR